MRRLLQLNQRGVLDLLKNAGLHTASCIDPRITHPLTELVAKRVFDNSTDIGPYLHKYPATTYSKDDWEIVIDVMSKVAEEYHKNTGKPYPFLLWFHNDCKAIKMACSPDESTVSKKSQGRLSQYVSSIPQNEGEFNYREYAQNVQNMIYDMPIIKDLIKQGKLDFVTIVQKHDSKIPNDISKCSFWIIDKDGREKCLDIGESELQKLQQERSMVGIE